MRLAKIFGYTAATVGLLALATCVEALNESTHTAAEGKVWLEAQGYHDVTGGDPAAFNGCGKNVFARKYEVANENNGKTDATVCYGMFNKYSPLFE